MDECSQLQEKVFEAVDCVDYHPLHICQHNRLEVLIHEGQPCALVMLRKYCLLEKATCLDVSRVQGIGGSHGHREKVSSAVEQA